MQAQDEIIHKNFNYSEQINIHYEIAGTGETPILFIHGFAACTKNWYEIIPFFSKEKYTIYMVDLKGFGYSSKPRDNHYTFSDQAKIIIKFIDDLNLKDLILVGHSYGGGVSLLTYLRLKEQNQNRIQRMILIDPGAYPYDIPLAIKVLRTPVVNQIFMTLPKNKFTIHQALSHIYYDNSKATDKLVNKYLPVFRDKENRYSYITVARQLIPDNYDKTLEKFKDIDIPVLIIWGRQDGEIPIRNGERLHKDIPGSVFKIIENCGHVPQEEYPEETYNIIAGFL